MYVHDYQKRIRYGETDQMGYLYYGNYPLLYEIGRSEAIRDLGISYQVLESQHKIMMPVLHMESRYMRPILYDELITIRTIITEMPTKIAHFHHEIYNGSMDLCHKGSVKLFFVDMETQRRVSTPAYLANELLKFFNE